MGAWGAGIYQNDYAADLKSTISLVVKIPGDNIDLLNVLKEMHPESEDSKDEEWTTFWLVVADQFEKRGILCDEITAQANNIITSGEDLRRLQELNMSQGELNKRYKLLEALLNRLKSPSTPKDRKIPKNPPSFCLDVGDVYAFQTQNGAAVNAWFSSWEEAGFKPNGWGALIVVDRGRAFDWLPLVAIASTTVDYEVMPTIEDVKNSSLMLHPQTRGAAKCVPKKSHIKRMKMEYLGSLKLNLAKAKNIVSKWSDTQAIDFGWSISSASFSSNLRRGLPDGGKVCDIL
ncbi:MAG: hypothetical protein P8163_18515 [Candidatus Thiodiazotropha sp.]